MMSFPGLANTLRKTWSKHICVWSQMPVGEIIRKDLFGHLSAVGCSPISLDWTVWASHLFNITFWNCIFLSFYFYSCCTSNTLRSFPHTSSDLLTFLPGQRSRSTCCPARPSSCATRSWTTRRRPTTCSRTRPTRRTSAATRPRSPASRPSSPSRSSPSRSRSSARTCPPASSAPSSRRCSATTPSRATCRWPCLCSSCWGTASAERSTTSRRSDGGDAPTRWLSCLDVQCLVKSVKHVTTTRA